MEPALSKAERAPRGNALQLNDFFAGRNLPGPQKRLNQRTLSAHSYRWKTLEPFARRHFRIGIEPLSQEPQLGCIDPAFMDPRSQMAKKCFGKKTAADLGMGLVAVKATHQVVRQPLYLRRVGRASEASSERFEFFGAELPRAVELARESHHFRLFGWRQLLVASMICAALIG